MWWFSLLFFVSTLYTYHYSLLMSDFRSQDDVRGGDGESAGHCGDRDVESARPCGRARQS